MSEIPPKVHKPGKLVNADPVAMGTNSSAKTTPAPLSLTVGANASRARNLMLCALALSFLSLFQKYTVSVYPLSIPGTFVNITVPIPQTESGFGIKPFAVFVLLGLLAVFGSGLREAPFWKRWGCWIALALLICFASLESFLFLGALALTGFAIYFNGRAQKEVVPAP